MAEVVKMPKMSDTMTDGVLAKWHKKVGDSVKSGDLVAEVETDKATMDFESFQEGTLLYIGPKEGESVPVEGIIAVLGKEGEDFQSLLGGASSGQAAPAAGAPSAATDQAQADSKSAPVAAAAAGHAKDFNEGSAATNMPAGAPMSTDGTSGQAESASAETSTPASPATSVAGSYSGNGHAPHDAGGSSRLKASPLARKMAEEKGIDLVGVKGSAENGRIVKKDIENYKPQSSAPAATETAVELTPGASNLNNLPSAGSGPASSPVSASGQGTNAPVPALQPSRTADYEDVPVSQMRKTIARRLAESMFTAPHFYLTMSVRMDKAMELRSKINEVAPIKISFNDFVLKAVALSLKQHPKINSSWLGDKIRYNHAINIGVAVAVDEGLLVPVVKDADSKSLSHISKEVKDFAQKAKDKKLQPSDWEGSTFTISNLGMFGIDEFTAIINPTDSCILAIGGISQVPVVDQGQVVPGNVMKLTLSCDHRVVDGATGAAFLQTVKAMLEEPFKILV